MLYVFGRVGFGIVEEEDELLFVNLLRWELGSLEGNVLIGNFMIELGYLRGRWSMLWVFFL